MALYADALEDSRVAAFTLLVVAPAASLTARWLVSRGQKTSHTQAWLFAILVPAVIIALPSVRCGFDGQASCVLCCCGCKQSISLWWGWRLIRLPVCFTQWLIYKYGEQSVYRMLDVRSS